ANTGIQFKNVSKIFPGVKALDNVSFEIAPGEVHALVGENGAGKSTLLNILHGVYSGYEGEILIGGTKIGFKNAHEAITSGILKVHQEVNVILGLTVGQNVALGYEPGKKLLIDFKKMNSTTDNILQSLGCKFRSSDLASTLSAGEFQMLSIAKALFHKAKIISFDEPTAALTNKETDTLFDIIAELKKKGITIIYVSHRLDEIFKIADRATVLRDGKYIGTYNVADITREDLIKSMVGRDVSAFAVRHKPALMTNEVVLEVKNLSCDNVFDDVSFILRKGELLGFAGLVGSKRTDVMRAIFGADRKSSGEIYIKGKKVNINSPQSALHHGIGLIPENRKMQGFVKLLANSDNVGLASLSKFSQFGLLNHRAKNKNCEYYVQQLHIYPADPSCSTENLSGGNQQKVILAKWLSTKADIFIFDEPTKGVDVGAKWDIYCLLEDLLEAGKSIIMVSSELPEIIGMSDRVMVMHEGRLVKELARSELNEEKILYYAMEGK
ncbi:MAG: sugar ABC transporter ATP-binding protein, partial [Bacteroidota bacterium]